MVIHSNKDTMLTPADCHPEQERRICFCLIQQQILHFVQDDTDGGYTLCSE